MKRIKFILTLLTLSIILISCCKTSKFTDIQENIYNTYTENQNITFSVNDTDTLALYVYKKPRIFMQYCHEVASILLNKVNSSEMSNSIIEIKLEDGSNGLYLNFENIYSTCKEDEFELKHNLKVGNKVYNEAYYLCSQDKNDTAFFVKNTGLVKVVVSDSLVFKLINY